MNAKSKQIAAQLAASLEVFKKENPYVVGIMQGGVEIGYFIARQLQAAFTPLLVQRLVYPLGKKFVFGAVAEDGSRFHNHRVQKGISQEMIDLQEDQALDVMENRKILLRRHFPLPQLNGRTVIIVDDDIATGSTMMAALTMCRNLGATRFVIAAPKAPRSIRTLLRRHADEVIVLPPTSQPLLAGDTSGLVPKEDKDIIRFLWRKMKPRPKQQHPLTPATTGNKKPAKTTV